MAGEVKGIYLEIGGNTIKLQKALSDVSKETKRIQTELKYVERALKLDPKNVDLIRQKQTLLAKQIDITREKLEALKNAEIKVKEAISQGIEVNQEDYRRLQREIVEATSELKNLEKQSFMANTGLDNISNSATNFGNKAMAMGNSLKYVSAGLSLFLGKSYKMAADVQDAMGATEQIFKKSSDTVKQWADKLPSYYGIAKGEALEYASTMGAMLQNIGGLTEQEAAKQSQILVELASDLTAMFGGTTESAVQALTGALKGNTAMLDNYGMGVNDATIKAKAFEMGIYSGTGAMDLQAKQAATLQLIMEQTSDAQGQAGREAEGASGSMRSLEVALKNLSIVAGEVLIPIITPFIQGLVDMLEAFRNLPPEVKTFIVILGGIGAIATPFLMTIGQISIGIGILTGKMSLFGVGATTVGTSAKAGVGVVGLLGKAFAALTSPIGLAILAILGIGLILYGLYKDWDKIKEYITNINEKLKQSFEGFKNSVKEKMENLKQNTVEKFNALGGRAKEKFQDIFDFIKNIWDKIIGFFKKPLKFPDIERPKIPLPDFKISGKFSINPPSVPNISAGIKWYAQGGIFDTPSVIGVGEAGKEAVLPIDKLDSIMASAMAKNGNNEILLALLSEIKELRRDYKEIPYIERRLDRQGVI